MELINDFTRRDFLRTGTIIAGLAMVTNPIRSLGETKNDETDEKSIEKSEAVSPPEDLMREHGALSRLLLIYDDVQIRMEHSQEFPLNILTAAAGIIHHFIEDYHEKLEEEYLFPRFEKAQKLADLVKLLRLQHQAGRRITEFIETQVSPALLKNTYGRSQLTQRLCAFNRMYRPHKAREETVLFPAIRSIVSPREFAELGEIFEDREQKLFGKAGFTGIVEEVAKLEKTLGIYDLSQFTPQLQETNIESRETVK